MLTKDYSIEINASAEKVWYTLWDDAHYRRWTSVFSEGSYAVTDHWKEGSRVHFLNPDGRGMYSDVTENKPFAKMVFTHIGDIKDFKELELTDETREWTGGQERYFLTENNGVTTLTISVDIYEKFMDYFEKTFPLALAKVKELAENFYIIVQTSVDAPIEKVWGKWNNPADINTWCTATPEWQTINAENDLSVGGKLKSRMEAKDGSMGFDFEGVYTHIESNKLIEYSLGDGRKVRVSFESEGDKTKITEEFEPESMNPFEMQQGGWQAILDNFKKHVEG